MTKSKPELPDPINRCSEPYDLQAVGCWGVLSDVHVPFHDRITIELFVKQCKKHKVQGVLLNGDILDFHELSSFDRTPDDPRYKDEVVMGRRFLEWLRFQLPKIKLVYKEGNHEERLIRYLCRKAPALFGLDVLTTPSLLEFREHGIDHVADRRVIHMGKLNVLHGHEFWPAIQTPVNPARGLFLRAKSVVLGGHFHQTSEHHEPTITGKAQGAWSVGCACGLQPFYNPHNKWNHGFAFVEVSQSGEFSVLNRRVLNGEVV